MTINQNNLKLPLHKIILSTKVMWFINKKRQIENFKILKKQYNKKENLNIIFFKIQQKRFNIFLTALDYSGKTILSGTSKAMLDYQKKKIRKFKRKSGDVLYKFIQFFLWKLLKKKNIKQIQNIFWNNTPPIFQILFKKLLKIKKIYFNKICFNIKQNQSSTILRKKKIKRK